MLLLDGWGPVHLLMPSLHLLCVLLRVHLLRVMLLCLLRVLLRRWLLLLRLRVHVHLLVLGGRCRVHSLVLLTWHRIEGLLPSDWGRRLLLNWRLVYILWPIRGLNGRCHFLLNHGTAFLTLRLRLRYHWAVYNE